MTSSDINCFTLSNIGNMATRRNAENMAIPLCLPNNCQWSAATGEYIKTGERRSSLYVVDEALQKLRTVRGKNFLVAILVENALCDHGSALSTNCRYGRYNQLVYRKRLMLPLLHFLDLAITTNVMQLFKIVSIISFKFLQIRTGFWIIIVVKKLIFFFNLRTALVSVYQLEMDSNSLY